MQQLSHASGVDLDEVDTFVRVVDAGSFRQAGRQLGVRASTVSRRVARLERDLGVLLLRRTTRSLSLTDAGKAYFDRVAAALSAVTEATAAVSDEQAPARGKIRITAPVDFGNSHLAELLAGFTTRHGQIQVDVELTGRTVNLIEERFDLGLRIGRLRDSSLVARKLADVRRGVFATPEYFASHSRPNRPADLGRHRCVLFRAQRGREKWRLESGERVAEVDVTGSLVCEEFLFVKNATLAHGGVGFLPMFLVAREVAEGRLERVLSKWAGSAVAIYVVYPTSRYMPQRVRLLVDYLLERFSSSPWEARAVAQTGG